MRDLGNGHIRAADKRSRHNHRGGVAASSVVSGVAPVERTEDAVAGSHASLFADVAPHQNAALKTLPVIPTQVLLGVYLPPLLRRVVCGTCHRTVYLNDFRPNECNLPIRPEEPYEEFVIITNRNWR